MQDDEDGNKKLDEVLSKLNVLIALHGDYSEQSKLKSRFLWMFAGAFVGLMLRILFDIIFGVSF